VDLEMTWMAGTGAARPFLVGRLGSHAVAVPAATVERVVRMAAITRLPNLAQRVVGVLNLHGEILPVVDPRPIFGLPTPPLHLDQHLVVLSARTRYILWVDRVERVITATAEDMVAIDVPAGQAYSPFALRLNGVVIPGLSPDALDPGLFMHQSGVQKS
jgi:purine-binding chemotaxis protein CheW